MINDYGYLEKAIANMKAVAEKQEANIKAGAMLMADAIAADRLINVYAGGGHTTLAMGEMFFRAGGLAAWTYRGGYGTVVGAPDALKLWDTIGENYRRVCGKGKK